MKIINEQLLDETTARAKQSPRLRMNYNFMKTGRSGQPTVKRNGTGNLYSPASSSQP